MNKSKLFDWVIFGSLSLWVSAAFGIGRTVTIDDVAEFDGGLTRQARGTSWTALTPETLSLQGNEATPLPLGFDLKIGASLIAQGNSVRATEDGQLFLSGSNAAGPTSGIISLFAGKDLFASSAAQYTSSVGLLGTNRGYSLGEFKASAGNYLAVVPPGVGPGFYPVPTFDPNVVAPDGSARISRFSWFGMTDVTDTCNSSFLTTYASNPTAFGNSYAGTGCAQHLATPRYFGQITLIDVGSREDGDFDLFLNYGTPFVAIGGPFSVNFVDRKTLFGQSPVTFGGLPSPTQYAETVGPTSTSGFILGNQKFEFGTYDAGSSPYEFRFRGGVACSVTYDALGNESGCQQVTQLSESPNLVPLPGIALLFALGGIGLIRVRAPTKSE